MLHCFLLFAQPRNETVTEAKDNIWNPLRETWGLTQYVILASKLTKLSLLHILQTRIKAELENHLNIFGFISAV